jgi:hypothetical protein
MTKKDRNTKFFFANVLYLGVSAIEKVRMKMSCEVSEKNRYDAILMDFVMPNMDGPTGENCIYLCICRYLIMILHIILMMICL